MTAQVLLKGPSRTQSQQPAEAEGSIATPAPVPISEQEYHKIADEYLELILGKFDQLQDEGEDVDVKFSVCSINKS